MTATIPAPTTTAQLIAVKGTLAQTRYSLRATRRLLAAYSHIPVPPGLDALATALEALTASVEGLAEIVERQGQR